jgi:hypothetical protein
MDENCSGVHNFCLFVQCSEDKLDPITDTFRTMHVTAFDLQRLEATALWGVKQENQAEEKSRVQENRRPLQIWRLSACFRAATAG